MDTYLFVRQGSATSGGALHENDDIVSGNTDSQIVATLAAGAYTIEATTYNVATAGSFTLTVSVPEQTIDTPAVSDPCLEDLGGISGRVTKAGTWADDCQSQVSGRGYARYFSFTLTQGGEVTVGLTSTVDTYLFVRQGSATSGAALHENDDIVSGNTDSQIVATLAAGAYTIEATTYNVATAGSFTLTVSVPEQTIDTPAVSDPCLEDLGGISGRVTKAGTWADDCQSQVSGRGYARYFSFTLTQGGEVTVGLTSTVDTYLFVRQGSATSGGALHENDDIVSGNTDSQIVATLAAGAYTIEATTYNVATAGSFTLTVTPGQWNWPVHDSRQRILSGGTGKSYGRGQQERLLV